MNETVSDQGSRRERYVLIGLVAFLLIFSVVQAVQVNTLQELVQEGGVASAPRVPLGSSSGVRGTGLPPQGQPQMVGGC